MNLMSKKIIWISLFVGSLIGSYIPTLWGGEVFSMSSIVFSGVGGFLGVIIGYKLGNQL